MFTVFTLSQTNQSALVYPISLRQTAINLIRNNPIHSGFLFIIAYTVLFSPMNVIFNQLQQLPPQYSKRCTLQFYESASVNNKKRMQRNTSVTYRLQFARVSTCQDGSSPYLWGDIFFRPHRDHERCSFYLMTPSNDYSGYGLVKYTTDRPTDQQINNPTDLPTDQPIRKWSRPINQPTDHQTINQKPGD